MYVAFTVLLKQLLPQSFCGGTSASHVTLDIPGCHKELIRDCVQRMCTKNVYKECVQGIHTRNAYRECVQGMRTRNVYKECELGVPLQVPK